MRTWNGWKFHVSTFLLHFLGPWKVYFDVPKMSIEWKFIALKIKLPKAYKMRWNRVQTALKLTEKLLILRASPPPMSSWKWQLNAERFRLFVFYSSWLNWIELISNYPSFDVVRVSFSVSFASPPLRCCVTRLIHFFFTIAKLYLGNCRLCTSSNVHWVGKCVRICLVLSDSLSRTYTYIFHSLGWVIIFLLFNIQHWSMSWKIKEFLLPFCLPLSLLCTHTISISELLKAKLDGNFINSKTPCPVTAMSNLKWDLQKLEALSAFHQQRHYSPSLPTHFGIENNFRKWGENLFPSFMLSCHLERRARRARCFNLRV